MMPSLTSWERSDDSIPKGIDRYTEYIDDISLKSQSQYQVGQLAMWRLRITACCQVNIYDHWEIREELNIYSRLFKT